jgi:hypothetical protein
MVPTNGALGQDLWVVAAEKPETIAMEFTFTALIRRGMCDMSSPATSSGMSSMLV